MIDFTQELMTPLEAARWFRRSQTWIRDQRGLLRLRFGQSQPLYHVDVCRAFVLGTIRALDADRIRHVQIAALEASCGLRRVCRCGRRGGLAWRSPEQEAARPVVAGAAAIERSGASRAVSIAGMTWIAGD